MSLDDRVNLREEMNKIKKEIQELQAYKKSVLRIKDITSDGCVLRDEDINVIINQEFSRV